MKEIYKDVKDYEGLYQISNLGNVKALDRYNIDKNGKRKFYPGKNIKPEIVKRDHTNYQRVSLSKNGKVSKEQVHRLVATAFIENTENGSCVNHIDNNGLNNNSNNLEWCTHSQNMLHAQKQGRLFKSQQKGGKVGGSKLRAEALDEIHNYIGLDINGYKVLKYKEFRNDRHYVEAQCLRCSSKSELAYRHITRGTNTRCVKCRNVKDENIESWKNRNKI